jgi:acetyl esterase/lipase
VHKKSRLRASAAGHHNSDQPSADYTDSADYRFLKSAKSVKSADLRPFSTKGSIMSRNSWFFAALGILVLQFNTARAADPPQIELKQDIQYGAGGDEKLHLDIAWPKNVKEPLPCIVFIHGGGWAAGRRTVHTPQIQDTAKAGYVAATVTYRLAPKHLFPAQIEDVKCAVRFLRAKADEYHIDKSRIGAIGFSAGAHLSMMLGAMDKEDGLEGNGGHADQSSKVQAVVSYFGPTDLTREYPPASRNIVKNFIGGTLAEKADAYKRASPITYVNAGDAPMLLLQGSRDELVPHDQAVVMADALTKAGVPGRVELMLGARHGWGGKEGRRTTNVAMDFFAEQLKEPSTRDK